MKRLGSSDSLAGLMSICPNSTDEHNLGNNPMYTREFQTMLEGLDEEGCIEESGHISEKKRRLSVDQVKALEKNFEVENKLEPERKVKLAQELGLQPRQVAVWFQNRRARWKTKQLERDYGVLKADYDGLKLNFDKLKHDNEALLKEIRQLKSNLNEDGSSESKSSMKEEDEDEQTKLETPVNSLAKSCDQAATQLNLETFNVNNNNGSSAIVFADLKDGSSDSDSSAILNDDHNHSPPAAPTNTHHHHHHHHHQFLDTQQNGSSSSTNINFQFSNSTAYQPQFVKIEEHNFFGEESCSTLFSDDQPPTLHWYCSDEWN